MGNGQDNNGAVPANLAKDIDEQSYGALLKDARQIIETSRQQAYNSINVWLILRNWHLGRRIAEEELHGEKRAEYGAKVIKRLSADLTNFYGKGFDASNLYKFTQFYRYFPNILDSVSPKYSNSNLDTLRLNSKRLLSWSHYRTLLQVDDADARQWYAKDVPIPMMILPGILFCMTMTIFSHQSTLLICQARKNCGWR